MPEENFTRASLSTGHPFQVRPKFDGEEKKNHISTNTVFPKVSELFHNIVVMPVAKELSSS
jgi:hypothetical protein